ncbi:MAG: 4-hydroxythreonine-4-phosphate dehydrogenase PdxA, partial [Muribaculaceae bacterium]|nr:4-hydroxythreonine-4-phosphate dehydrogenase PdxA [Muribaculaceae bacterium]
LDKLVQFSESLKADFGIHHPRIAVLALNPHCGDSGLLGSEENEIIIPAIEAARERKIDAFGPYPADGFFGAAHYDKFDGVLAMYHDQGLAPLKALGMDSGVNLTAGLPFVRTSPDHGTAYDIAGQGTADAQSMRCAIYAAVDSYRNRMRHFEATANPLPKLYVERGRDNVKLNLD